MVTAAPASVGSNAARIPLAASPSLAPNAPPPRPGRPVPSYARPRLSTRLCTALRRSFYRRLLRSSFRRPSNPAPPLPPKPPPEHSGLSLAAVEESPSAPSPPHPQAPACAQGSFARGCRREPPLAPLGPPFRPSAEQSFAHERRRGPLRRPPPPLHNSPSLKTDGERLSPPPQLTLPHSAKRSFERGRRREAPSAPSAQGSFA